MALPNLCTQVPAGDLVPTGSSYIGNYLNHISSNLTPLPAGQAVFTDTCVTNNKGSVTPGVITAATLTALNQETKIRSSACSITFYTGVYSFQSNAQWIISNGSTIVGGTATGGGTPTGCNNNNPGVQFQFGGSYSSSISITKGNMYLCPISTNTTPSFDLPVIAAPLQGSSSPYYWTDPGTGPFLNLDDTGGNTIKTTFNGPVFAPAGYASIKFNSSGSNVNFTEGAVFRAMTLNNNLTNVNTNVAVAPPFNGSRVVQLRFLNTETGRDVGIVQIAIDDSFGLSYANNYKIISWSVAS